MAAGRVSQIAMKRGFFGMGIPTILSAVVHVGIAAAAVLVGAGAKTEAPNEPIEFMVISLSPPSTPAGGDGGGVEQAAAAPLPPAPKPVVAKARPKAPQAKPAVGMPVASKEPVEEVAPEVVEEAEELVELAAVEQDLEAGAESDLAEAVGGQLLLAMAGGTGSGMGLGIGVGHGTGGGQGFGFGDGAPVDARSAKTQPRPQTSLRDNYPMAARRRGIEGVVRVRLVLDKQGRVERELSKVVKSVPALDKAAIEAANELRFSPALDEAGNPIRVIVELPIRYELSAS